MYWFCSNGFYTRWQGNFVHDTGAEIINSFELSLTSNWKFFSSFPAVLLKLASVKLPLSGLRWTCVTIQIVCYLAPFTNVAYMLFQG